MKTITSLERRCRYRLGKHGLRVHKVQGNAGPVYYAEEIGCNVPERMRRYYDLDGLLVWAEELEEKEHEGM